MKKIAIVLFSVLFIFISGCKENEVEKQKYMVQIPEKSNTESIVVYVTKTGECYHRLSCSCLKYSKFEKELSEVANKYCPCQICCPPVMEE